MGAGVEEGCQKLQRREQAFAGDFYALVSGDRIEDFGASAKAAWELEHLGSARGWPSGERLGSETALRARLHISRETLREAVRVVESRGGMEMRRGRSGGLTLCCPRTEQTAAAIAAYLRAAGITTVQIEQSVRGFHQLLAWQLARTPVVHARHRRGRSPHHWLIRNLGQPILSLYGAVLDELVLTPGRSSVDIADLEAALAKADARAIFSALSQMPYISPHAPRQTAGLVGTARAAAIAVKIAGRAEELRTPDLGSEASLCEEFSTSRGAFDRLYASCRIWICFR